MSDILAASKKADPNLHKYVAILSEKDADANHWIDSGSYALNRIISSSVYGGIPEGSVIALAGDAQTGKSFLANRFIADAQENQDYICIHYDTEGALSRKFATNLGVDTTKLLHVNVDTAQQVRNHCINTLEPIIEKHKDQKFMVVLDSVGNLSSEKEQSDMRAGKTNADMGERAKSIKSMLKELTKFCTKNKMIFIFTNHTYKDVASAPNPKYAKTVQAGGKITEYAAHAVLMLSKKNDKDDSSKEVKGDIITVKSEKNRFCKSKRQIEIYISYSTGPNRYYGLLDDLAESGMIEKVNEKNYIIPWMSDSKGNPKKIHINQVYKKENREIIFSDEILGKLDDFCKKHYAYASVSQSEDELDEELEAIENEIDEDDEL
jgi:RecA/RadA recombinase